MNYLRGGKILRIDLTNQTISTEPIEDYTDRFIGGKGINVKLLFDATAAKAEPLNPGNAIVFGAGTLVGTPFPGACRLDIQARSPVTRSLGYAGMGGYFSARMKTAGYDNIVVTGKAEKPVYVYINDDKVEIKNAGLVWRHDTYETPEIIRREVHDPTANVISIGPTGEKLVVYASVVSPTGNSASRTGMGCVMGSKNLKAIAVNGSRGIIIACPEKFLKICNDLRNTLCHARPYEELHRWGLTRNHDREMVNYYDLLGIEWNSSRDVSEETFVRDYRVRTVGCITCPVACFQGCSVPEVGAGSMKCSPPGDLTWDLRNKNMHVYWETLVMCQRNGIDARAVSNSIAWLMKLHELGIITAADTDGLSMEWGNTEAILGMTRKILFREGFGAVIGQGLTEAARQIGRGAENYLFMAHGSPADMHWIPIKTRVLRSAVSPVGGDSSVQPPLDMAAARAYIKTKDEASFLEAIQGLKDRAEKELGIRDAPDPRTTKGKAALIHQKEIVSSVCNITGECIWLTGFMGLPVDIPDIAHALTLGFGKEVTVDSLTQAALRLQSVERAFSQRLGLSRSDDTVSNRLRLHIQRKENEARDLGCSETELETMKDDYYNLKGWDVTTGLITRVSLEKLDLNDVADALAL